MRVDFFEEYPTPENLAQAAHISWPARIYLAARSLEGFRELRAALSQINPRLEAAYWPILEKSYWVSPLSYPEELARLSRELHAYQESRLSVLIDLEFPLRTPTLFARNIFYWLENKKAIGELLSLAHDSRFSIVTAEHPPTGPVTNWLLHAFGLSYLPQSGHQRTLMYYNEYDQKISGAVARASLGAHQEISTCACGKYSSGARDDGCRTLGH